MMRWVSLILLSVFTLVLAPLVGENWLGNLERDTASVILWEVRLPRVLLAFVSGAALSVGGLVFQSMFRNALATPYTLGVASGSAFAVSLIILLGWHISFLGVSSISMAALVGATASIFIVYWLAKLAGGFATISLLLGGVVLGFFFSSLTMLAQYFTDAGSLFRMMRWTMGSFSESDYDKLVQVLPFALSGIIIIGLYKKELDLMCLGDDLAKSRGLEVERVRKVLFLGVSLMMAGVVAACGPIGFVGIMVPHFCRMLFGALHRDLVWSSVFLGGCFLVWCDTLARSITTGSDLPVGIVTALLGGPFFIFLLVNRYRSLQP